MISYEELAAAIERDKAYRTGAANTPAADPNAEDQTFNTPPAEVGQELDIGEVISDEEIG